MTRSLTHSTQLIVFFHLLFIMIATPCLLVNLPDSITTCPCSVSQTSLLDRHVSEISTTSHVAPCTSRSNSPNLSLELIDLVFFCRTVNTIFSGLVSFLFGGESLLLPLFPVISSPVLLRASVCCQVPFVFFIRDVFKLRLLFVWRCADAAAACDLCFFFFQTTRSHFL